MEAGRGGGGEAEAARKLLPPAAVLTLPGACAHPQHREGPGVGSALQPGLRVAALLPLGKGGWRMGVVRFVLAAYFGEEEEEVAVQSWSWDSCRFCMGRFHSPCSCERSGGCLASAPAKGQEMKMSPCICIQTKAREAAQQPSAGARPPAARVAKQMGCRVLNQLQFLRSCLDNEHHSTQAYRS